MKKIKSFKVLFITSVMGISTLLGGTMSNQVQAAELIELHSTKQIQQIQEKKSIQIENQSISLNMEVSVDELGIASKVAKVIQNANQLSFSRSVADEVFKVANGQYNVIVFTSNSAYKYNFNGIKFSSLTNYNGVSYYIWVFEHGRFEMNNNKGKYSYRGWVRVNAPYVAFYRE
ncbi:hypothetical protein COC69_29400 [Bacillus cereus]|uniref:Stress protein n=1 Tax=Bacillus cereus TaxID=1396 RepID=A0A9X7CHV7_BACCE|nr:hypothetical protein [Bacillus cereus]PGS65390.1 hypothetical protein COC69_29400 [Bacillus cereus]